MPFGDPAGYLPNVKRARKRANPAKIKRNFPTPVKGAGPRPPFPGDARKAAAKTGGAMAPAKLSPEHRAQALRRRINELRSARREG
jgi:hypothetical protein